MLYANAAAHSFLGQAPRAIDNALVCDVLCEGLKDSSPENAAACPLRLPLSSRDAITFKGKYAATGRELRVRCMRMRLPGPERRFLTIEDVSAQAEAGRHRKEWRQMLAHDFRGPLSVALGTLCALKEMGPGHPLAEDDLALIEGGVRNCRRLDALINAYLDTTRLEEGGMPVHAGHVDVTALLNGVIGELNPAARADGRELTLRAPDALSARADPELLNRALANIIGNALKFTPSGGRIRIDAETSGPSVLIRIADDGPGITPQDLPRIFDRYYQGARGAKRRGLGLGLTFCRAALRAMGGEITAASEPGHGAVFTLSLPSTAPGGSS